MVRFEILGSDRERSGVFEHVFESARASYREALKVYLRIFETEFFLALLLIGLYLVIDTGRRLELANLFEGII